MNPLVIWNGLIAICTVATTLYATQHMGTNVVPKHQSLGPLTNQTIGFTPSLDGNYPLDGPSYDLIDPAVSPDGLRLPTNVSAELCRVEPMVDPGTPYHTDPPFTQRLIEPSPSDNSIGTDLKQATLDPQELAEQQVTSQPEAIDVAKDAETAVDFDLTKIENAKSLQELRDIRGGISNKITTDPETGVEKAQNAVYQAALSTVGDKIEIFETHQQALNTAISELPRIPEQSEKPLSLTQQNEHIVALDNAIKSVDNAKQKPGVQLDNEQNQEIQAQEKRLESLRSTYGQGQQAVKNIREVVDKIGLMTSSDSPKLVDVVNDHAAVVARREQLQSSQTRAVIRLDSNLGHLVEQAINTLDGRRNALEDDYVKLRMEAFKNELTKIKDSEPHSNLLQQVGKALKQAINSIVPGPDKENTSDLIKISSLDNEIQALHEKNKAIEAIPHHFEQDKDILTKRSATNLTDESNQESSVLLSGQLVALGKQSIAANQKKIDALNRQKGTLRAQQFEAGLSKPEDAGSDSNALEKWVSRFETIQSQFEPGMRVDDDERITQGFQEQLSNTLAVYIQHLRKAYTNLATHNEGLINSATRVASIREMTLPKLETAQADLKLMQKALALNNNGVPILSFDATQLDDASEAVGAAIAVQHEYSEMLQKIEESVPKNGDLSSKELLTNIQYMKSEYVDSIFEKFKNAQLTQGDKLQGQLQQKIAAYQDNLVSQYIGTLGDAPRIDVKAWLSGLVGGDVEPADIFTAKQVELLDDFKGSLDRMPLQLKKSVTWPHSDNSKFQPYAIDQLSADQLDTILSKLNNISSDQIVDSMKSISELSQNQTSTTAELPQNQTSTYTQLTKKLYDDAVADLKGQVSRQLAQINNVKLEDINGQLMNQSQAFDNLLERNVNETTPLKDLTAYISELQDIKQAVDNIAAPQGSDQATTKSTLERKIEEAAGEAKQIEATLQSRKQDEKNQDAEKELPLKLLRSIFLNIDGKVTPSIETFNLSQCQNTLDRLKAMDRQPFSDGLDSNSRLKKILDGDKGDEIFKGAQDLLKSSLDKQIRTIESKKDKSKDIVKRRAKQGFENKLSQIKSSNALERLKSVMNLSTSPGVESLTISQIEEGAYNSALRYLDDNGSSSENIVGEVRKACIAEVLLKGLPDAINASYSQNKDQMNSLNELIEYLNNNTTSHEKWIQYARAALAVGEIDQYISLLKQSTSDAGPLFNKVDNYNAMDDSTLKSYIDKLDSALATQEKGVETLSDEARDKKDKVDSLLQEKMESCKVEVEYRRQYDKDSKEITGYNNSLGDYAEILESSLDWDSSSPIRADLERLNPPEIKSDEQRVPYARKILPTITAVVPIKLKLYSKQMDMLKTSIESQETVKGLKAVKGRMQDVLNDLRKLDASASNIETAVKDAKQTLNSLDLKIEDRILQDVKQKLPIQLLQSISGMSKSNSPIPLIETFTLGQCQNTLDALKAMNRQTFSNGPDSNLPLKKILDGDGGDTLFNAAKKSVEDGLRQQLADRQKVLIETAKGMQQQFPLDATKLKNAAEVAEARQQLSDARSVFDQACKREQLEQVSQSDQSEDNPVLEPINSLRTQLQTYDQMCVLNQDILEKRNGIPLAAMNDTQLAAYQTAFASINLGNGTDDPLHNLYNAESLEIVKAEESLNELRQQFVNDIIPVTLEIPTGNGNEVANDQSSGQTTLREYLMSHCKWDQSSSQYVMQIDNEDKSLAQLLTGLDQKVLIKLKKMVNGTGGYDLSNTKYRQISKSGRKIQGLMSEQLTQVEKTKEVEKFYKEAFNKLVGKNANAKTLDDLSGEQLSNLKSVLSDKNADYTDKYKRDLMQNKIEPIGTQLKERKEAYDVALNESQPDNSQLASIDDGELDERIVGLLGRLMKLTKLADRAGIIEKNRTEIQAGKQTLNALRAEQQARGDYANYNKACDTFNNEVLALEKERLDARTASDCEAIDKQFGNLKKLEPNVPNNLPAGKKVPKKPRQIEETDPRITQAEEHNKQVAQDNSLINELSKSMNEYTLSLGGIDDKIEQIKKFSPIPDDINGFTDLTERLPVPDIKGYIVNINDTCRGVSARFNPAKSLTEFTAQELDDLSKTVRDLSLVSMLDSMNKNALVNQVDVRRAFDEAKKYSVNAISIEKTKRQDQLNVQERAATTLRGLQNVVSRELVARSAQLHQSVDPSLHQSAKWIQKAFTSYVAYLIQNGLARVESFKNHAASPASEDSVVAIINEKGFPSQMEDISQSRFAAYLNCSSGLIDAMQILVAKQVLLGQGGGPNSSDTWAMFMRIDLVIQGASPIYARLSMMASDFKNNWVNSVMDFDSSHTKDLLTVMQLLDPESANAVSTLQFCSVVAVTVSPEEFTTFLASFSSPTNARKALGNAAYDEGDRETSQSSLSSYNSLMVAHQTAQKLENLFNKPTRAITDTTAVQTGLVSSNQPDQALFQKVLGGMTSNFQGVSYPDMMWLIGRLPVDTRGNILSFISDDNSTISLTKLDRFLNGGSEIASANIANLIPAKFRQPLLNNMSSNSTTVDGGREVSAGAYPINPSYLLILAMLTAFGVKSALSGLLGNTAPNANNQVSFIANGAQNQGDAGSGSEEDPDSPSDTEALPAGYGRVICTHQNRAITETTYKLDDDKLEQINTELTKSPDGHDPEGPVVAVNASWDPDRASDMAYVVTYQAVDAFFKGNNKDQLVLSSLDYDQAENIYKAIDDCIEFHGQDDPNFRKERVSPDLLKNLENNLPQQSHESSRLEHLKGMQGKVKEFKARQASSGGHGKGNGNDPRASNNKTPGSNPS